MIAIIDYGAGNLQSVKKALDFIGAESLVTSKASEIENASACILPGVYIPGMPRKASPCWKNEMQWPTGLPLPPKQSSWWMWLHIHTVKKA